MTTLISKSIYENNRFSDINCDQNDSDGEDELGLEQCKRRKILVSKRRIKTFVLA